MHAGTNNLRSEAWRVKVSKPVAQYYPDGRLVQEYSSITEACKNGIFTPNGIRSVCNGVQKLHRGYIFKFKEK